MDVDLSTLEPRHAHDLLASALIPRPIAWVSTISSDGKVNLAPFSFFTGISWSPPLLAFSPVNRADGSKKDTVKNIEFVPEELLCIGSEVAVIDNGKEIAAGYISQVREDTI
jgi:flavin reductase (DIM6/NTAB) family NADH-FMN oxidoreductase RutF